MPNYYIWTIGCQMNKAESERLASLFKETGYQAVSAIAEADIIVVNTCVVRQNAEALCRQPLRLRLSLSPVPTTAPENKYDSR